MDYKKYIKEYPNFPNPKINFLDISPLISDPHAWHNVIEQFSCFCKRVKPDFIAGIESRGFILGASLATYTSIGLIPIRKAGKLPGEVISQEYCLEYGSDILELQTNSFPINSRILIVDDLLATGGTVNASSELVRRANGKIVGYGFVIEIKNLRARERITYDAPISSLINY